MTISIQYVDPNHVLHFWPTVKPFLEEALKKGEGPEDYNIDHLQMYLTSANWLLLVAIDEERKIHGAATVSFVNYPLHRVAFITAIGGRLISSRDSVAQLKALLKQRGATKIQGYGRESIVRLWQRYGFERRVTLVEVLL